MQIEIELPVYSKGIHLITEFILDSGIEFPEQGILHLFILHTSAGLTLNENYDPDVRRDFETSMNRLVPENDHLYTHTSEGPDDMPAHIKSSLVGSSLMIPISNRKLRLGTWQGIYLCEFRKGKRQRCLIATVLG